MLVADPEQGLRLSEAALMVARGGPSDQRRGSARCRQGGGSEWADDGDWVDELSRTPLVEPGAHLNPKHVER